jgi:hypothetical protein
MAHKNAFIEKVQSLARLDPVEIPGLDMPVFMRQLSAGAFKQITDSCLKDGMSMEEHGAGAFDEELLGQLVTCACLVDESGDRVIPEGDEEDLMDLPNAIVRELQVAAMKCNGMGDGAEGSEGN